MITNAVANRIIDLYTGRGAGISYMTVYLGLSTTTPTAAGGNFTEPSGNNYSRILLGAHAQSATYAMTEASEGASTNSVQLTFPKATGDWGTCTYAGIFDASTDGNLLWYGALTNSIHPTADHVALILPGDLDMTIA